MFEKSTNEVIVKIVNTGDKAQNITLNLNGLKKGTRTGSLTTYSADNLDGENTLDNPTKYVPQTKPITIEGTSLEVNIPAKSFAMYKIKK